MAFCPIIATIIQFLSRVYLVNSVGDKQMKKIMFCSVIALIILILLLLPISTLASEDIYGIKIENITRRGADLYWSTSIETKGSVEYGYSKLAQLYNPQQPGSSQSVLISMVPALVVSEDHYVKSHHVKLDRLDMYYDQFVQYTIKSQTFAGDTYTLSGEFVLVDTKAINWWQTPWFVICFPIFMFILGIVTRKIPLPTLKRRIMALTSWLKNLLMKRQNSRKVV